MRTILVIDDEKEFRKKYKKLLKAEGFKVLQAPNALEVANMLMKKSSDIDLILLDINLPEVDGRGIFDIIDEYDPNLKIVVTSIHPITDQKIRIPRAVDYFNKAQPDEILIKKVRNIVGAEEPVSSAKV